MKLNRKNLTLGIAGVGLAGILASGTGIAVAATGTTAAVTATTTTAPYGVGNMSEMVADMSGMASGMHGMAIGDDSPIATAASYLGLSQTDLQTQLQTGKSLADVAKAQGKPVSGLEAAMVTTVTSNLDANTALSGDQKAAILTQMKSHIDTMVNITRHSGTGFGPMGALMGGMGR